MDLFSRPDHRARSSSSEPSIFWRGEHADDTVNQISIPSELGLLKPAGENYNGPSGRALDQYFLDPLGVDRSSVWLCDLVPHTCLNQGQRIAVQKKYNPKRSKHSLPAVTIPKVPTQFADDKRRLEILAEIQLADPRLIILLGDQPIKWFLHAFTGHSGLEQFGKNSREYGKAYQFKLSGKQYNVLPLVHPRQAGALSSHSVGWKGVHRTWVTKRAVEVSQEYL